MADTTRDNRDISNESTAQPEAPTSRRAGAERTKDQILTVARRLFAERGFKGTSVADIADAAGLAPGTIYIHFENKEDLLASVVRESEASELPLRIEDVTGAPLADLFRTIAQLSVDETRKRAGFMTSMAQDARKLPATQRDFYEQTMLGPMRDLTSILGHRKETQGLDEETLRILAHGVLAATVFMVIEQQALGGDEIHPIELDRVPEVLGKFFAGGLAAFADD